MKIGIGTVQFGMDYGISNAAGKVAKCEVSKILNLAKTNGIAVLDTACAYGDSEEILGDVLVSDHTFSIVTKTPVFEKEIISKSEIAKLNDTFASSLRKLRQNFIYGLLVHAAEDLLKEGGGRLWDAMCVLKDRGLVKKIGVSIYTAEQIDRVLSKYSIDLIQVPVNVFDQRLLLNGYLKEMKKVNIEIHARSILLQGVLLTRVQELPPHFKPLFHHLRRYYEFVYKYNWTPLQTALGFVLGINELDTVLVGVESILQLQEIMKVAQPLDYKLFERFAIVDDIFLNPSKWKL